MKNNVCVYVVTQSLLYMNMALVSIVLLRKYNFNIPVKVFLVQDGGILKTTNNQLKYDDCLQFQGEAHLKHINQCFLKVLSDLNVQVIVKYPYDNNFVHFNRCYIQELLEPNLFFIDSDTFFFGDVAEIFEKYKEYNFVATSAPWISDSTSFNEISASCFGGIKDPPSSCLLMFNNYWGQKWSNNLYKNVQELVNDTRVHEWIALQKLAFWDIKEEIALMPFLRDNELKRTFFDFSDCCQVDSSHATIRPALTKIIHTFSYRWHDFYERLFGKKDLPLM